MTLHRRGKPVGWGSSRMLQQKNSNNKWRLFKDVNSETRTRGQLQHTARIAQNASLPEELQHSCLQMTPCMKQENAHGAHVSQYLYIHMYTVIFFCSILQLCSPIPSKRQKTGKKTSIERLGSCCRTLRIASATSWCWNIHRQLPTANGPCGYVLQGIDVQSRVDPWQNFKTSDLDWST